MSGRNIPSSRNSRGLSFLITISTICTTDAITTMKEMRRRYGTCVRTSVFSSQVNTEVITSTKMSAAPILSAVETRAETPMKGHRPRK